MASPIKKTPNAAIERHVGTILASIITAAILYVCLGVTDLKTAVAVVQASQSRLEAKVQSMDGIQYKVLEVEESNRRLEKRVDKLEVPR